MNDPGLNVRCLGALSHPAVLLLHGFLGEMGDWDRIAEGLARDHRVIMVDLPGHGESVGFPLELYRLDAVSHLICDLLDQLSIDRCSAVGYSMGGRVALQLAVRRPERIERLVLESTTAGLRSEEEREKRVNADEQLALQLEKGPMDHFLNSWYRQPVFASIADRSELFGRLVARRKFGNGHELARSLRQMGTGQMPPLWDELPRLSVPSLCLAGELDPKFVALAHEIAASMPNCRAHIIPGAGHIIHLEQPDRYLQTIREFLSR